MHRDIIAPWVMPPAVSLNSTALPPIGFCPRTRVAPLPRTPLAVVASGQLRRRRRRRRRHRIPNGPMWSHCISHPHLSMVRHGSRHGKWHFCTRPRAAATRAKRPPGQARAGPTTPNESNTLAGIPDDARPMRLGPAWRWPTRTAVFAVNCGRGDCSASSFEHR